MKLICLKKYSSALEFLHGFYHHSSPLKEIQILKCKNNQRNATA